MYGIVAYNHEMTVCRVNGFTNELIVDYLFFVSFSFSFFVKCLWMILEWNGCEIEYAWD